MRLGFTSPAGSVERFYDALTVTSFLFLLVMLPLNGALIDPKIQARQSVAVVTEDPYATVPDTTVPDGIYPPEGETYSDPNAPQSDPADLPSQ